MSSKNKIENQPDGSIEMTQKLMVHGFVCPDNSCALSVEVRRGMPILSKEGLEVGKVAAVILDGDTQKASHLLLGRLPEVKGYWLVPVELILEVCENVVQLRIPREAVKGLPIWYSME